MARFELVFVKVDRNGTKYYYDWNCPRCVGYGGSDNWKLTGWTCYECGGEGKRRVPKVVKEYTPEYAAKLDARRLARQAKYEADHAEEIAQAKAEAERLEAERQKAEAERKAREDAEKARKAVSQYVGEIGERITVNCVYEGSPYFDYTNPFGQEARMYIHQFRDEAGNKLVWKTASVLWFGEDNSLQEGEKVTVTGRVKDHSVYRDERQTALLRCKVARIA